MKLQKAKGALTDTRRAIMRHTTRDNFYHTLFVLFYCFTITQKPSTFNDIIIFLVLSHVASRISVNAPSYGYKAVLQQ